MAKDCKEKKESAIDFWSRSFASIRRDHTITPMARLLADEIDGLSKKTGYCWASNPFLSEIFKDAKGKPFPPKTISRWISELVEAGHISRIIDAKNGNERYLSTIPPEALARLVGCKIADDPIPTDEDSYPHEADDPIPTDEDSYPHEADDPIPTDEDSSINNSKLFREREKDPLAFHEILQKIPNSKVGKALRVSLASNLFLPTKFVLWLIEEAVGRFSKKIDLSDRDLEDWVEYFEKFGRDIFTEAIKTIKLRDLHLKGCLPTIGEVVKQSNIIQTKTKAKNQQHPSKPKGKPFTPIYKRTTKDLKAQLKDPDTPEFYKGIIRRELKKRVDAKMVSKSKADAEKKRKANAKAAV